MSRAGAGSHRWPTGRVRASASRAAPRCPGSTVAYETWGELDRAAGNGVLVLHALTGDSHAAGPAGDGHPTPGWWDALIGPGAPIDTDRFFVVCPNVLGGCQGTTGPSSAAPDGEPYGSRFPELTIRDQVAAEVALADTLGIDRWAAVVGGSMGGMRVLEWCVGHPERVGRAVVLAVGAAATAEQIALCSLQVRAIRDDPGFAGGDYYGGTPPRGRAGPGPGDRAGELPDGGRARAPVRPVRPVPGGPAPGRSVRRRVLPASITARSSDGGSIPTRTSSSAEAMNRHDVGRGRGGIGGGAGPGAGRGGGGRHRVRPPVPDRAAARTGPPAPRGPGRSR